MTDAPVCGCHRVRMVWNKDSRYRAGGFWKCRVKHLESKRPLDLAYWHKPDGGYIRRRRRHLAAQRDRIERELESLEQEAVTLC